MDQAHHHELIKDRRNCDLEFLPPLPLFSSSSSKSSFGPAASVASVVTAVPVLQVGVAQAAGRAKHGHDALEPPDGPEGGGGERQQTGRWRVGGGDGVE